MRRNNRPALRGEQGIVLVASGVAAFAMVALLGLTFDVGRMYIVKSEGQSWAEAAALSGATKLDGTRSGLIGATAAALAAPGRWNFGSTSFSNASSEFATTLSGPWYDAANAPLDSTFQRVKVTLPLKLLFLPIVVGNAGTVGVQATAAQVEKTSFREGLFPFSPFARNNTGPNFGLAPGNIYTLRWPANPSAGAESACRDDRDAATIAKATAAGGAERGYIEETSADLMRPAIVDDFQTIFRAVGGTLKFTGGAKEPQLESLLTRIRQDTDTLSATYAAYLRRGTGNRRRIVACPINDGGSLAGTNQRIVGFGAFFLQQTGEYGSAGDRPWCAEYVGSWVQGGARGANGGGAYVVRLVG